VSAHFGSTHDAEILDLDQASGLVPEVLSRLDEPLADASILPTYLLSRFTRRRVTVALSGDGGDELFAGYDPFLSLAPAALYERLVPRPLHRFARWLAGLLPISGRNMSLDFKLRRALMGLSYPRALWNPVWLSPVEPSELAGLFDRPLRFEELYSEALALWEDGEKAGLGLVERSLEFYTRLYLQDDILAKVDRAAMMCSLESRAVFLDNDLVDFVMRLPTRFKLQGRKRKVLLKKALAGRLPPEILARPKKGFGIPLADWLRNGLDAPAVPLPAGVKDGFVEKRLRAHRSGREDHRLLLWAWLAFAHRSPPGAGALAAA
jgi:asparagine synthase (glutamine-hydrolysing)